MELSDSDGEPLCEDMLLGILHWLYQAGDTITATKLLSTRQHVNLRARAKFLEQPAVFVIKTQAITNHLIKLSSRCREYIAMVDWGDNNWETISQSTVHVYQTSGEYRIRLYNIRGFNQVNAANEITSFVTIGNVITDTSFMFCSASAFNQPLHWDTHMVTNMCFMFYNASAFNQPLQWDTSAVTDMSYMFYNASAFNQPLQWDTHAVTNMGCMFYNASAFNQPLQWDTSAVTDMRFMFYNARKFNQPLHWDTHAVTNMSCMLYETSEFNQPLDWNR